MVKIASENDVDTVHTLCNNDHGNGNAMLVAVRRVIFSEPRGPRYTGLPPAPLSPWQPGQGK